VIENPSAEPIQIQDGKYIIRVPESRIVRLKKASPLNEWHTHAAMFADGTLLPQERDGDDDVIRLRGRGHGGGTGRYTCDKFFVGTINDARNFDYERIDKR